MYTGAVLQLQTQIVDCIFLWFHNESVAATAYACYTACNYLAMINCAASRYLFMH